MRKLNINFNINIATLSIGLAVFIVLAVVQNNKIINQNTEIVAQQITLTRLQKQYKNLYKLREECKEAKEKKNN